MSDAQLLQFDYHGTCILEAVTKHSGSCFSPIYNVVQSMKDGCTWVATKAFTMDGKL